MDANLLQFFANDIIAFMRAKDTSIDDEVAEGIKADLLSQLEGRVNMLILDNLSEQQAHEFDSIIENGGEAEIGAFIGKNIPNFSELLRQNLLEFGKHYGYTPKE